MIDKCCVCGKFLPYSAWICTKCGGLHCVECSGSYNEGDGEYPDEDAYSFCKNCCKKKVQE